MISKKNWIRRCFQNGSNGKFSMEIFRKKACTILSVSLAVLIVTVLLGCPAPNKEEAKVTEVTVSPATSTIAVDETVDLSATVKGTGDYDKTVTWSSSATTVATVSPSGLVKGLKEGKTTVTATANGNSDIKATATITVEEVLEVKIDFAKFDKTGDENKNIYNHFIDEIYDPSSPLLYKLTVGLPDGVTVDPPLSDARNYSDLEADIFTVTEGENSYKFRLHIIRRPIIVTAKPAANTDTEYDVSGASAISIRSFVQSDYYYVPTVINDTITKHPAPSFALFPLDAAPTTEEILSSPVRVLRNFTTDDGNTVFFTGADDGKEDDNWSDTGLNSNADMLAALSPSTGYSLHWAFTASNGQFSGSLGTVSTKAVPKTATSTGNGKVKYFGMGGMALHRVADYDSFSMLALLHLDAEYVNIDLNVSLTEPPKPSEEIILNGLLVDPTSCVFGLYEKIEGTKYTGTTLGFNRLNLFSGRGDGAVMKYEYVPDFMPSYRIQFE